jgi:hypothetical protein
MRALTAALCLAVLVSASSAKADTLQSFDFNATLQGGSASGTVVIDTTLGTFVSGNFSAVSNGINYSFPDFSRDGTLESTRPPSVPPVSGYFGLFVTPDRHNGFQIVLPMTSLVGFTGSDVCTFTARCGGTTSLLSTFIIFGSAPADPVTMGSLTPSTVTPEPSSIALLGTGLLALAAPLRSRFGRS